MSPPPCPPALPTRPPRGLDREQEGPCLVSKKLPCRRTAQIHRKKTILFTDNRSGANKGEFKSPTFTWTPQPGPFPPAGPAQEGVGQGCRADISGRPASPTLGCAGSSDAERLMRGLAGAGGSHKAGRLSRQPASPHLLPTTPWREHPGSKGRALTCGRTAVQFILLHAGPAALPLQLLPLALAGKAQDSPPSPIPSPPLATASFLSKHTQPTALSLF